MKKVPEITTRVMAPKSKPNQLQTRIPAFMRDHLELLNKDHITWEAMQRDGVNYVIIKKKQE